ncbi:cytochrome c family protein [Tabrizicola sp. J26]|uniref:c-type cytochrome n=1 Tax=Alitabrizicola rongguiensis TaxID=2909234 RepID=UPI001F39B12C|nr:cytochrome c family protein [Tabrizicola rongguiensis]MCF1707624.1 cytochrome c family protein [Tabrizicola rongguiensis]
MFDTMTFTKAFGALCGSLLVFLLIGWAGSSLYYIGPGHEEGAQEAYVIDTGEEAASTGEDAAAGPAFEELLASADPAAGEKVFAKCKSCHKVDGTNATGPHLNGVVNRATASVPDFAYSDALKSHSADTWTPDHLNTFLTNPKAFAPGTKMSFAGLPKEQDRANVVAYLATLP